MKKIILCISLCFSHFAVAENVIYKCTSSAGEVTYQNNSGDKNECEKTNFASFPSINFFKQDSKTKIINNSKKISASSKSDNAVSNTFVSEEQKTRDTKRSLILNQELAQEKEQLTTVSNMLKNLKDSNSKDNSQINQLEELRTSHLNNINAIQRELGNKSNNKTDELKIEKTVNPNIPNLNNNKMIVTQSKNTTNSMNLPISLPNEMIEKSTTVNQKVNSNSNKAIVPVKKDNKIITVQKNEKTSTIQKELINNINQTSTKEIKKTNKLGSPIVYSSGLSNMSKIKK